MIEHEHEQTPVGAESIEEALLFCCNFYQHLHAYVELVHLFWWCDGGWRQTSEVSPHKRLLTPSCQYSMLPETDQSRSSQTQYIYIRRWRGKEREGAYRFGWHVVDNKRSWVWVWVGVEKNNIYCWPDFAKTNMLKAKFESSASSINLPSLLYAKKVPNMRDHLIQIDLETFWQTTPYLKQKVYPIQQPT